MSSQVRILIPATLKAAPQSPCLNSNTSIPPPPLIHSSSLATCSISSFVVHADNLLSTCCNTTDHTVLPPYAISAVNDLVVTGGYTAADGCDWSYCNVTGRGGVEAFAKCVQEAAPGVGWRCFVGGSAQTSGARRSFGGPGKRSGKGTGKKTLSAGLLMALGVAGIFLG